MNHKKIVGMCYHQIKWISEQRILLRVKRVESNKVINSPYNKVMCSVYFAHGHEYS